MEEARDRFYEKVNKTANCWLWTGSCNSDKAGGHGRFGYKGKLWCAHRFAYELEVGPIPAGLFIRHKCISPNCVNPAHLETGTNQENQLDRIRDGTMNPKKGEENPASKLTWAQVEEIRASDESGPKLARRYGVSHTVIYAILKNKIWKR